MRHGIALRSIFTVIACACIRAFAVAQTPLGKLRPAAHEVSFEELLAHATFFDGQPVRLVGVADLSVEFEAVPKLYFSREAFMNRTYQDLDVEFSEDWMSQYPRELRRLKGRYALVGGIFRYRPPEKIDPADGAGQICVPSCPTSGFLTDISFVNAL